MSSTHSKRRGRKANHPDVLERGRVFGHVVQYGDEHHIVLIDGVFLPCTAIEYRLLLRLFHQVNGYASFASLLKCFDVHTATVMSLPRLRQVISRLRAKLWPFDLDIFCVNGRGYMLFPWLADLEQTTGSLTPCEQKAWSNQHTSGIDREETAPR